MIKTNYIFNPTSNWRFEIEFITSSSIDTTQTITSGRNSSSSTYGLLLIVQNSRLNCYIGNGRIHIIDSSKTNISIKSNTKYKWAAEYKNGVYYLSLNGSVYYSLASTLILVSNIGQYFGNDLKFPGFFKGSIDLKQFSIAVDGKEVFNGLMSSTKPIYDKITTLNTNVSDFELETSNNFSAVNSALNEKANLSDLSKCASLADFNRLSATVTALEGQVGDVSAVLDNINGEVI